MPALFVPLRRTLFGRSLTGVVDSVVSLQPFLHASRHRHAVRRSRGPHGRFATATTAPTDGSAPRPLRARTVRVSAVPVCAEPLRQDGGSSVATAASVTSHPGMVAAPAGAAPERARAHAQPHSQAVEGRRLAGAQAEQPHRSHLDSQGSAGSREAGVSGADTAGDHAHALGEVQPAQPCARPTGRERTREGDSCSTSGAQEPLGSVARAAVGFKRRRVCVSAERHGDEESTASAAVGAPADVAP